MIKIWAISCCVCLTQMANQSHQQHTLVNCKMVLGVLSDYLTHRALPRLFVAIYNFKKKKYFHGMKSQTYHPQFIWLLCMINFSYSTIWTVFIFFYCDTPGACCCIIRKRLIFVVLISKLKTPECATAAQPVSSQKLHHGQKQICKKNRQW